MQLPFAITECRPPHVGIDPQTGEVVIEEYQETLLMSSRVDREIPRRIK